MEYDRSRRRQVRTPDFTAHYVRDDVGRFLDYQRAVSDTAHFYDEPDWIDFPFTDADALITPFYDQESVRILLEALRQQRVVEVEYWSKTSIRGRLISQHRLIFADGRYHVRAYCHEALQYVDFVLTRIMSARLTNEPWVPEDEDRDWHRRQDLKFQINPRLPDSAQAAIRLDHHLMEQDRLVIRGVRAALAYYVQRRLCRNDWRFEIPLWQFVGEV